MANPLFNAIRGKGGASDPFGSMQGFMGQFRQFMQNPMGVLAQKKLNLPENWQQDPNGAIQNLLNTNQMTQEQYNQLRQIAGQIQQNPQFAQFINAQKAQK